MEGHLVSLAHSSGRDTFYCPSERRSSGHRSLSRWHPIQQHDLLFPAWQKPRDPKEITVEGLDGIAAPPGSTQRRELARTFSGSPERSQVLAMHIEEANLS